MGVNPIKNTMSQKQIVLIRDLFNQVKDTMPDAEVDNLVVIMNAHINGVSHKDTVWAGKAIEKLKGYKTKMVLEKLKAIRNQEGGQ